MKSLGLATRVLGFGLDNMTFVLKKCHVDITDPYDGLCILFI